MYTIALSFNFTLVLPDVWAHKMRERDREREREKQLFYPSVLWFQHSPAVNFMFSVGNLRCKFNYYGEYGNPQFATTKLLARQFIACFCSRMFVSIVLTFIVLYLFYAHFTRRPTNFPPGLLLNFLYHYI